MVVRLPFKLIADLTFGVEELYDLTRDPTERRNLAESLRPERSSLRASLDAWLAALAAESGGGAALARGRLGDRTVARDLLALARDRSRPSDTRAEAVTLLASYDYFSLRYPHEGLKGGFIYKTVPHVTLKSIANNPEIDAIYERLHPGIDAALAGLDWCWL